MRKMAGFALIAALAVASGFAVAQTAPMIRVMPIKARALTPDDRVIAYRRLANTDVTPVQGPTYHVAPGHLDSSPIQLFLVSADIVQGSLGPIGSDGLAQFSPGEFKYASLLITASPKPYLADCTVSDADTLNYKLVRNTGQQVIASGNAVVVKGHVLMLVPPTTATVQLRLSSGSASWTLLGCDITAMN